MSAIESIRSANRPSAAVSNAEQRILSFHREGLDRFARIIDGNKQYDILLSHRLSDEQIGEFPYDLDAETARARALALSEQALRKRSPRLLHPTYSGFVCDGRTSNNLREFAFFERLCAPLGIEILAHNYAAAERRPPRRSAGETEAILETILFDVRAFYAARKSVTASLVHQQILYSKSFFNFLLAFTEKDAVLPTALVLANDHSPVRVALSMVMKGLGVPRVYLQHAEVSECFPPLDFEHSILRNNRSLAVYERIAPVQGRTYVIARESTEPKIDALRRPRDGQVEVVIYPTSRVVSDALRDMLMRLKGNPNVSNVALKQHPGAAKPLDAFLEGTGVALLKDFPTEDHIAIAGNSSVAVELIAKGIPVYQNFDFDPVESDYYGFVRDGLTREVKLEQLSGRFWTPYRDDKDWLAVLSQWLSNSRECDADAAAFRTAMAEIGKIGRSSETTPSPQKRRSIKKRMKRILRRSFTRYPRFARYSIKGLYRVSTGLSRIAYRTNAWLKADVGQSAIPPNRSIGSASTQKPVRQKQPARRTLPGGAQVRKRELSEERARRQQLAAITMSGLPNPADWLLKAEALGVFESIVLIRAIDAMMSDRNPSISALFEGIPTPPRNSLAGVYAYLKRSEWINAEIDSNEIDRISDFINNSNVEEAVRRRLADALFSNIISIGTSDQLDHMLSHDSLVQWQRLAFNRRLQVLRKLANTGRIAEAAKRLEEMKQTATPLEALKLRNFEFLSGILNENWSHQDAEHSFLAVAPSDVAQDFETLVRPTYNTLRERMLYMEARVDAEQRNVLLHRVQTAIAEKRAFSCIRLSDREGYLFAEHGHFTTSDVLNCENHWWGTQLDPHLRAQIVSDALAAVGTADVVGIPAIYRFIRDVSPKTPSLIASLQSRGLVDVLVGIRAVTSPKATFSEDKVNVGVFGNIDTMARLASHAHRLVIATSVHARSLPEKLRAHKDMHHLELPTHFKTQLNERYVRGDDILPHVYPRLIDELEKVAEPGTLVLVAGGLIGKILVGRAREKGAVVLDIGHVIDDWANSRLSTLR
ncbi:hypothetical protein [Pelagibacterium lentulum]|uniref:Uncharacterized protein n=1 Tax=Pelagibacterium lentulum TaxID=2029865 RepID=A0A916R896_9HYPH|nr:hypothetical protein [Pelagibacterium lentulum]GGA40982.1 hypothetical protein GCM10011499_08200 [Pelagibacterium lentulum]